MNSEIKSALILPAKYPEAGNVKTRLIGRGVTAEKAAAHQKTWLLRSLRVAVTLLPYIDVYLRLPTEVDLKKMQNLLEEQKMLPRIRCMEHTSKDITENLRDAILELFADGYGKVVSLATDIARPTKAFDMEFFDALDNHDVVIGSDQHRTGINGFGIKYRGNETEELIHELFSQSRDDLSTYDWVMQIVRDPSRKLRSHLIPGILDIDTVFDLARVPGKDLRLIK